jgi:hypothetical protein
VREHAEELLEKVREFGLEGLIGSAPKYFRDPSDKMAVTGAIAALKSGDETSNWF